MIRTIDTYRSVSRTATAQIVFNDQEPGDSRPYQVEAKRDGVNYGCRWYMTEDKARDAANNWIENPEGSDWANVYDVTAPDVNDVAHPMHY